MYHIFFLAFVIRYTNKYLCLWLINNDLANILQRKKCCLPFKTFEEREKYINGLCSNWVGKVKM